MHRLFASLLLLTLVGCVEPPDPASDAVREVISANREHFRALSVTGAAYAEELERAQSPAEVLAALQRHHAAMTAALHGINSGYVKLANHDAAQPTFDAAYDRVRVEGEAHHEAVRRALVKALKSHRDDLVLQAAIPGLTALKATLFEQRAAYNDFIALIRQGELAPLAQALPAFQDTQRRLAAELNRLYFQHPYLELAVDEVYLELGEAQRGNLQQRDHQREELRKLLQVHAGEQAWCDALVPREALAAHLTTKAANIEALQQALLTAEAGSAVVAALDAALPRMIAVRQQDHDWERTQPVMMYGNNYAIVCPDLDALRRKVEVLAQAQQALMKETAERYKLDPEFGKGLARIMSSLQAAEPRERSDG